MHFVRIKVFIWRMLLSMMKSRIIFLIVLSQDIQAGRNILILSPAWFLSERAKLESCQKSTRSNRTYGSEDSTSPTSTMKSHGKRLFKLRSCPLFAPPKKLPLFSNTTLRNRTIFMNWIYKTDELHSIELALWWHYGCKYFQSKLECASSEKMWKYDCCV